jgi:hypothetical protein
MKTISEQIGIPFDPEDDGTTKPVYKCRYCDRVFISPCSVGGHVSQTHSKFKLKKNESIVKDEPQ